MILIVDADPVSGPSLARLLRYNGHAAEVIPSAMEALALLHTRKPTAIILDTQLPDMQGLVFIRAVHSDPLYSDVPLVVYTGDFSQEVVRESLALGAVEVIVKGTVGTQSLLARIEKHLKENGDSDKS